MAASLRLILTFQQAFEGIDAPQAFSRVEAWAASEGAKVKVRRPPTFLEASHGTKLQLMGWKPNASKRLLIQLQGTAAFTQVSIQIVPSAFYPPDIELFGAEKANRNFGEMAGRLWAAIMAGR